MRGLDLFACASLLTLFACSGSGGPGPEDPGPDGALAALADAEEATLYALHPYPHELRDLDPAPPLFHEYGVLGQAPLAAGTSPNALLNVIESGIERSEGMVAACFNPRHGLRVVADGVTWDLVICYECLSLNVYRDDVKQDGHLTSEVVEPEVSAVFAAAGLTLHSD